MLIWASSIWIANDDTVVLNEMKDSVDIVILYYIGLRVPKLDNEKVLGIISYLLYLIQYLL